MREAVLVRVCSGCSLCGGSFLQVATSQMFWSRERVYHHLCRAKCGRCVHDFVTPLTEAESQDLDQMAAQ
eukprot:2443484-Alexandrium_andersonii.AAC.1